MKTLIVGNWKCNPKSKKESLKIFQALDKKLKGRRGNKIEVVICPPFVYLPFLLNKKGSLKIGAQNCFWEEGGTFTGEISPLQLRDLGCRYLILGHSERRRYFGETDETVNRKIKKALECRMAPILCLGENLQEKEAGLTKRVIENQVKKGVKGIGLKGIKKIAIAYEPVWAIGSENPCPLEEAQSMGLLIRKTIAGLYSKKISENLPVLYGGSLNSENASFYIKEARFNGLLVGGASLKPEEFFKIISRVS
jgi:triosephosphate isomerase (TIM)